MTTRIAQPALAPVRSTLRPRFRSSSLPRTFVPIPSISFRHYSSAPPVTEDSIISKLTEALKPSQIRVMDTSGGCGTFFNIDISSKAFNGLSKVKQHKLVQDLLKQEVKDMHGLSLRTLPEEEP